MSTLADLHSLPIVFGDSFMSWIPAWGIAQFAIIAGSCALIWLLVRFAWGKPITQVNPGLAAVRLAAVTILIMILLGPTVVDEEPGATDRSALMLLYDGSSSMSLGQQQSRWQQCLNFVDTARQSAGEVKSDNCPSFRFGHRLEPLLLPGEQPQANKSSATYYVSTNLPSVAPPDASDSRLADALRQLLSRVRPDSTDGVVLLSDGRVRTSESVEALADHFGKLGIPIHVVPVGKSQGTGDIAIVSLVAESKVRKFTEHELQIFFRSFGYTGERTTVRLLQKSRLADGEDVTLATLPVTLVGGPQSASLKFRVDVDPMDLVAVIDPLDGELAEENNRVKTHIDIDRTKLRVLYVEGSAAQQSLLSRVLPSAIAPRAPSQQVQLATLRQALQQDEDIECVTLISNGGRGAPTGNGSLNTSMRAFPQARSELFAFDCIVLSNVSPRALEDEQLKRIAQWVDGRGGGLIVTGADALVPEDWHQSPLEPIMPIEFTSMKFATTTTSEIDVTEPNHPIWRLSSEQRSNASLLASIPGLETRVSELQVRPTVQVIAQTAEGSAPVLMSHRFGRGRVVASTVDLGGRSLSALGSSWGTQSSQNIAKFWRNMVYWATEGSSVGRRRLVAESDKRFYRPGDALKILARAYDESASQDG